MSENNISNLANELLKTFHTQFAENQRTREQSFLKIIGFIGAVVLGYAYVYANLSQNIVTFSFVAFGSNLLLLFGAFIVVIIAYNFRRDQYVNSRIRNQAGIIGKKKAFPEEYNPSHLYKGDKPKKYLWMPDIFSAFFHIFPLFQLLIILSYLSKLKPIFALSNIDFYITVTVII